MPNIDVTRPSPARVYDYLLGGTDNYQVDREAAERVLETFPQMRDLASSNRIWLRRVVTHMTVAGITQFLDIGSGLPTAENVHQVAQRINPEAKIVYIDNDPIVLAHGRSILESNDRTTYTEADLRDPEAVLQAARSLLDLTQPVGLVLAAVLHFVPDNQDPAALVADYVAKLPAGSYVAISHATSDNVAPELLKQAEAIYNGGLVLRPRTQIRALFGDLEPLPPGFVDVQRWPDGSGMLGPMRALGGLARL